MVYTYFNMFIHVTFDLIEPLISNEFWENVFRAFKQKFKGFFLS